jgi:hypothetical protein
MLELLQCHPAVRGLHLEENAAGSQGWYANSEAHKPKLKADAKRHTSYIVCLEFFLRRLSHADVRPVLRAWCIRIFYCHTIPYVRGSTSVVGGGQWCGLPRSASRLPTRQCPICTAIINCAYSNTEPMRVAGVQRRLPCYVGSNIEWTRTPEPQPYIGLIVSNPWNHSRVWRVYTVQCAVHLIFSARCTCTVQQCCCTVYSIHEGVTADPIARVCGFLGLWLCFL